MTKWSHSIFSNIYVPLTFFWIVDQLKAAATPKKKYYLACGNCHWTTRDAGYEDKELSGMSRTHSLLLFTAWFSYNNILTFCYVYD